MSKLITAQVDYVDGHLRYGHWETTLTDEQYEEYLTLSEELRHNMIIEEGEFILDDYRVNDRGDITDIEVIDIDDNIDTAESLLMEASNWMDDTHGYDTNLYKRIDKFFENETK